MQLAGRRVPLSFPEREREVQEHEFVRIVFDDCYRIASIEKPVRTVLDIGANIGLFALAARRQFADAQIYCYEPNPAVLDHLRRHCASVGAHLNEKAVGRNSGAIALRISHNSLHTTAQASATGEIACESFASVVASVGKIDLLKLDCEGAEWDILQCEDAWKAVRSVTMEYHLWAKPHATVDSLRRQLANLGFSRIEFEPSPNGPWGFALAAR